MSKIIDLTNQRFGRLLVIERAENSSDGRARWKCLCDCGKEKVIRGKDLRSGNTQSCGCYHIEQIKKKNSLDISNSRFGKLVAIEPTERRAGTSVIWKCKCDCGNICYKDIHSLRTNKTNSCGCIKNSIGEWKIEELLKEMGIQYEKEKIFSSCIYPETKANPRFDFYLPEYNIVIEYDGIQHYQNSNFLSYLPLEEQQKRDTFKNNWCNENDIKIIRIPYTDYNILNIEYIKEKING